MSHFSVLVIGPDPEKQLAPYHEFECTGRDDEFVVDVDVTEAKRTEFLAHTDRVLVSPAGEMLSKYDDRFYREPTADELVAAGPFGMTGTGSYMIGDRRVSFWRGKVNFIPDGWVEREVLTSERATFAEWLAEWHGLKAIKPRQKPDLAGDHKYGYVRLDAKGGVKQVIDRTNPNAKWDWYVLGGRWRGFFKLRRGRKAPVGESGAFGNEAKYDADQAQKGDIDFAFMQRAAERKAHETYDRLEEVTRGLTPPAQTWSQVYDAAGESGLDAARLDAARAARQNDPWLAAIRADRDLDPWDDPVEVFCIHTGGRAEYVRRKRQEAVRTFAVVKDGKWYERGAMGVFACVAGDVGHDRWQEEYEKLLAGLPDDTLLSVYDCHV